MVCRWKLINHFCFGLDITWFKEVSIKWHKMTDESVIGRKKVKQICRKTKQNSMFGGKKKLFVRN